MKSVSIEVAKEMTRIPTFWKQRQSWIIPIRFAIIALLYGFGMYWIWLSLPLGLQFLVQSWCVFVAYKLLILLVGRLMYLHWNSKHDDVYTEPLFNRLWRNVFYAAFVPITIITYIVLKELLLHRFETGEGLFLKSILENKVFQLSLVLSGLSYTVFGAMKSSMAVSKAEDIIKDLVDTQVTASGGTSDFVECFQVALLKPMEEAEKRGNLLHASLLLANPIYGLYSKCERKDRVAFWNKFIESKADRELILYSPDAHYNFLVRSLLTYSVKYEIGACGMTSDGVIENTKKIQGLIMEQIVRLREQSPESKERIATDKGEEVANVDKSLKLWLTADSGYRIAKYDYELTTSGREGQRRTNVFVILTHPSSMEHGPNDFVGTLIPITQTLHKNIAGSKGSVYEQFKQCPYTLLTEDDARVKSEVQHKGNSVDEYTAIALDMLYLRTSNRPYRMAYLKEVCMDLHDKFAHESFTDPKDSIKAMIGCFVYYFQRLREPYGKDESYEDYRSMPQVKSIDEDFLSTLEGTLVSGRPSIECIVKTIIATDTAGAEISKSHFINEYELFANSDHGTLDGELKDFIAVLYFILSSGFRESKYAEFRRNRNID